MKKADLYDYGIRVSRTDDGKYKMIISKEYISGDKQDLITKVGDDLKSLLTEFEKLKANELEDRGEER